VIDWIWSTAFYGSALLTLAGAIGLIRPLRRLHRNSRRRALVMTFAGVTGVILISVITPSPQSFAGSSSLDKFMPAFHFREHHSIEVSASPVRVYDAIRTVAADEIALFNLFTGIRRLGRPGPESILNAPAQQPILDVAIRTGFILLEDRAPAEVVLGAVVVAPPGLRRDRPRQFTASDFTALAQPGFAKATMNFRVEDLGNGRSRVDTETRVFATDDAALARFTPYWRVVLPGSSILRMTWLRAIRTRAERPVS